MVSLGWRLIGVLTYNEHIHINVSLISIQIYSEFQALLIISGITDNYKL